MSKNNIYWLGFDDRLMMLIGIPIVALTTSSLMFGGLLQAGQYEEFTGCITVGLIYSTIYWLIFREVSLHSRKRYPNLKDSRRRLIYLITLVFVVYFLVKGVLYFTVDGFIDSMMNRPEDKVGFQMAVSSLVVTFLVLAIYEGIYFHAQLTRSITEKEQLERENIQSQLEGLRNQVNPHFLFNSLNTLSYLIPEDTDRSLRFVQRLSKVYRYILEIKDEKLISIREELAFIKSYVYLLEERFGQNLRVDIRVPEKHLSDQVVPLSLQILLENAIKHNIISTEHPLSIEIFIEQGLKLIVKNNLQKKKQQQDSTKVGLQNIKNRYQFFTDKTVDVIVSTSSFIVALPLLELPD